MGYGYYRFPKKQKSKKTLLKEDTLSKSDKIIIFSELEKLSTNDLHKQKVIYESELNLITEKYSNNSYKEHLKIFDELMSLIKSEKTIFLKFLNAVRNNFYISTSYYIKKIFFTIDHQLVVNEIKSINNQILKKIADKELEYREFLKKINILELLEYFKSAADLIKEQSTLFDINTIENFKLQNKSQVEDKILESEEIPTYLNIFKHFYADEYLGVIYENQTFEEFKLEKSFNIGGRVGHDQKRFVDYKLCKKEDFNKDRDTLCISFDSTGYDGYTSEFASKIFNEKYTQVEPCFLDIKIISKHLSQSEEVIKRYIRKIELILRSRSKQKEKSENYGHIYVLSNEAYPNIYKIGSTYGLPEERAEELTGTGHLNPFAVVGKTKVQNAEYYEKIIHKLLKNFRVKKNREFFEIELKKINDCLKHINKITEKGSKTLTLNEIQKNFSL